MCDVQSKDQIISLAKVITGDKAEWDSFIEMYAGLIYNIVERTLRAKSVDIARDVIDVSQDVFVRLIKDDYRLLRSYNPQRATLHAWLTVVSTSVALNSLRRPEYRQNTVELDGTLPANRDTPFEGRVELPPKLLSERQNQVLKLFYNEGYETAEIARALNIAPQTVRSIKHQAIVKLREYYCIRKQRRGT